MASVASLVIDKTGTLTDGRARLVSIETAPGMEEEVVLRLAASLDQASKHVIAGTIVAEAQSRGLRLSVPSGTVEVPGEGISGDVDGRAVIVGGPRFVAAKLASPSSVLAGGAAMPGAATVAVAIDGAIAGRLVLADMLRPGAKDILRELKALKLQRIVLATGIVAMSRRPSRLACRSTPCIRSSRPTARSWWFCRSANMVR